jgi:hypothetical protein
MLPPTPRFGGRSATLAALLAATLATAPGCRQRGEPSPRTDFLLSAGDSTFWVQSHRSGYRMRASPILLASFDGRFHEIYVTDEDRSYSSAIFVGQRVWRRDILSGDSVLVFEDSLVVGHAARFEAANPGAIRLGPDEEIVEDPERSVTTEVSVLDVHGPYLSFEHHADYEDRGVPAWHATRRGVIDLRSGREVTIADVAGREAGRQLLHAGRRSYLEAIDSAGRSTTAAGRRVAASLPDYSFEDRSFTITHVGGEFAVAFAAPGRGEGPSGAVVMLLDPVVGPPPEWWGEVRKSLPDGSDTAADRWRRPGYQLMARYDTGFADLVVADARGRDWTVGRVPTPVGSVHWLDEPRVEPAMRAAIARAFDEAAYYDETVRTASLRRNPDENGEERKGIAARDLRADDAAGRQQPRPRFRGRHPVDDGQVRRDRRVQAFADERGHRVDRPRGLPRAHTHG